MTDSLFQDFVKQTKLLELKIHQLRENYGYFEGNIQALSMSKKLMMVERCFVTPFAFPKSPQKRHLLFSVSDKDSYSSSVMAGVYDGIDTLITATSGKERYEAGRRLAEEISLIQEAVICAINTIAEYI